MILSQRERLACGLIAGALLLSAGPAPAPIMVAGRGFSGPAAAPAQTGKGGLHIPQGRQIGFTHYMTDGAGFRWDIQYYGNVGSGTNNAYGSGMYCRINGSNTQSNGQGWANAAGDEIELGGRTRNGLTTYRRVKVYKDRGLARWLEILRNDTAAAITVSVQIQTACPWQLQVPRTSSGAATAVGQKDWAFITQPIGGPRVPALLHVFGDKHSKVRPTIMLQNRNQILLTYSLTVPAKGTALLCHFEAQGHTVDDLAKTMKGFKARKLLADLSPAVRKLIVNFSSGGGLLDVELDRSDSADSVVLKHGDPLFGTVRSRSFPVKTLFGPLDLPAEKVLGMASSPTGEDDSVRFVLADGQVVGGLPPAGSLVELRLPTGADLRIPLADVKHWSYRISKQRPEEIRFAGPLAVLRTGDQLGFDPAATPLKLRTRHGTVPLDAKDLLRISLDNPDNAVHRVHFRNGSVLGGFLEPANLSLKLRQGTTLEIPRDMVRSFRFALEEKADPGLSRLTLSNGDQLHGRLLTPGLTLATQYGSVPVNPVNATAIAFSRTHLGRAAIRLWNGTVLRGQLKETVLAFRISPGPEIRLHVNQIAAFLRAEGLPPAGVLKRVGELIELLGAESYKDRQRATEALSGMDPAIAPVLKKHLKSTDPEVRQRIQDILKKLAPAQPAAAPVGPGMFPGMQLQIRG